MVTESELGVEGHSHVSFSHDAPTDIVASSAITAGVDNMSVDPSTQHIPSLINGTSK